MFSISRNFREIEKIVLFEGMLDQKKKILNLQFFYACVLSFWNFDDIKTNTSTAIWFQHMIIDYSQKSEKTKDKEIHCYFGKI